MEITYTLEQDDYARFSQFLIRRTPALKRQMLLRYLVLPVIIAFELTFLHLGAVPYMALLLLATGLWALYLRWMQKRAIGRVAALRPGAVGLHTMRLDAAGLRNQDPYMTVSVEWGRVIEVLQNAELVFLLLSANYGFMVPLRAFSSLEQAQAFVETARAYRKAARDGTAPVLPQASNNWPPAPRTVT